MPVTIIVGGQYGSEGKGKVAYYYARKAEKPIIVRCGGTNSGHTIIDETKKRWVFRQLPTAAVLLKAVSVLCAGTYIDLNILKQEIEATGVTPKRLRIDPNAVIITSSMVKTELNSSLRKSIGSTCSGTGEAVMTRIRRNKNVVLAKNISMLSPYITTASEFLRDQLDLNKKVIIEGTQGIGLSLLHSKHYPYTTSRDTSAASFLSEVGLSPLDVNNITLVIRAFPIRACSTSGPLEKEISWPMLTRESCSKKTIVEFTSVTKRLRRVARFHPDVVITAIQINRPTRIVLNHLDYIPESLAKKFVEDVEKSIYKKIDFLGLGPGNLYQNEYKGELQ